MASVVTVTAAPVGPDFDIRVKVKHASRPMCASLCGTAGHFEMGLDGAYTPSTANIENLGEAVSAAYHTLDEDNAQLVMHVDFASITQMRVRCFRVSRSPTFDREGHRPNAPTEPPPVPAHLSTMTWPGTYECTTPPCTVVEQLAPRRLAFSAHIPRPKARHFWTFTFAVRSGCREPRSICRTCGPFGY